MILDLTQVRQPETDITRRYEPGAFEGRGHLFRVVAPVDLRLKVQKDKVRFRLTGHVSAVLELTCSRCLEPYELPVDADVDIRYLPQSENKSEHDAERQVEEDDLSDAFYRDEVIDLGQVIDEQFYLAQPMKPLCRDQCKGLCSNCGANLNAETCDCQVRWEDPRLAVLKTLTHPDKDHA